jgi:hypothetical protein
MDAITPRVPHELDFHNFDELADFLAYDGEAHDPLAHSVANDLVPLRAERVTSYAGAPGALVQCPVCGIGGKRVFCWVEYFCEACGYANTEPRSATGE